MDLTFSPWEQYGIYRCMNLLQWILSVNLLAWLFKHYHALSYERDDETFYMLASCCSASETAEKKEFYEQKWYERMEEREVRE